MYSQIPNLCLLLRRKGIRVPENIWGNFIPDFRYYLKTVSNEFLYRYVAIDAVL